jgi:hypothetical protein
MNDMDDSPFEVGLRYNERASAAGAQTERRGEAGPVSILLRLGLTGRFQKSAIVL